MYDQINYKKKTPNESRGPSPDAAAKYTPDIQTIEFPRPLVAAPNRTPVAGGSPMPKNKNKE